MRTIDTITMTPAETETYDAEGQSGERLMRELKAQARERLTADVESVEIHTADGVVAAVVSGIREA